MKHIRLTQNQVAVIDDEDFERVNQFKWSAQKIVQKGAIIYYAKRTVWADWKSKKQKTILLHRFIVNAPDGIDVDHKNGNTLDNRRCNLRLATRSKNRQNSRKRVNCLSKYKGVELCRSKKNLKYRAVITLEGKDYRLGYFQSEIEAALAYDRKAKDLFGEFARLNFPEQKLNKLSNQQAA